MADRIVVAPLCRVPVERCAVELCEHKGIGHPDCIVDGACEAASRALARAYRDACGRILHHNLDKGLLVAGRSRPRFGGGEILAPFRLILGGRATSLHPGIDARRIAVDAARTYLHERIRCAPGQFEVAAEIAEGAANLQEVFARAAAPLANDTSFGCGYAPYSRLERAVLALAQCLKSETFRQRFPAAGYDFKIMGSRVDDALHVTLALALIDRHVQDVAHYFAVKRDLAEYLSAQLPAATSLHINTLDDMQAQNEDGVYLTVTGLSAEMGDDGQAGRGNRVNGLITPNRAMSLEAVAGKNPVAHVGKLYNVLAMLLARDIHERFAEVEEVSVQLLARIGAPVDQPELAALEVAAPAGLTHDLRQRLTAATEAWLARTAQVTDLILAEGVTLF